MAVIRKVEISHFRSIKSIEWYPSPGLNCLIGSGDAGKSTVLDAIDLCLGARRSVQITDADFHELDVETPISITLTFGALSDALKNYEAYGDYLRGYQVLLGTIEDEPGHGLETVLSLNLEIAGDLEPRWRLRSDRADAKGAERNLNWKDRVELAPTRLGATTNHNLAWRRGSVLPTCVLGDPMQAIFGWGTNVLIDWAADVQSRFPPAGLLDTPWRWRNAGTEPFGRWLLTVRAALQAGHPIDLRQAPPEVEVITVTGDEDVQNQTRAANTRAPVEGGSVLIVCDARRPPRHREIAARARGTVVVENADLTDFIRFAASFDIHAATAADELIDFAGSTMTGVGAAQMKQRLRVLLAGRERSPPNDAEAAALAFARAPSPTAAVALLVEINRQAGVFPLRPALVRSAIQAFNGCIDAKDFHDMAIHAREQSRVKGRALPRRAVGSTLLLKELEADVAVVIDTDSLSARDLYVAMTRGSRKLVICTTDPVLLRPT